MTQRVDLMAARDGQEVGAIGTVGLIGAVDRGAPVRGATDHRRRENATDMALRYQVPGVADRRRHLALQSNRVQDTLALRSIQHPASLVGIAAERPFAIDVLACVDRGHHRLVMVGHLHADRDQIDIGMSRQLFRIGECQRNAEMSGCCIG